MQQREPLAGAYAVYYLQQYTTQYTCVSKGTLQVAAAAHLEVEGPAALVARVKHNIVAGQAPSVVAPAQQSSPRHP
jgi:hypothetical protein